MKIREGEYFPADLLLIQSSGKDGICYVETKSLDGETNLKNKFTPKLLQKLDGSVSCEGPNKDIYKFDGTYTSVEGNKIPLTNDNVLLRGMSLKNTDSCQGIVLYTGHESKLLMNSAAARYKISKVMKTTYKSILIIIFL